MLKITKISQEILKKALDNLPKNYIECLKSKINFEESIVARYLIFKEKNILVEVDNFGKPIFNDNIFFSISHKKGIVFVGTYDKKIGVDIEIIKKRGKEVFFLHSEEEYKIFGGKNLENFYYLWTIKESVIKLYLSGIDFIKDIKINNFEKGNFNIDGLNFSVKISGNFQNNNFVVYSKKEENLIYSLALEEK